MLKIIFNKRKEKAFQNGQKRCFCYHFIMYNSFVTFFTISYYLETPIAAIIIDQYRLDSQVNLFYIFRKSGKKIKTEIKTETEAIHHSARRIIRKSNGEKGFARIAD